jgi:hypothetical protein
MSKVEAYIQGWLTGDLDMIQDACAGDFVYDDAVDGRVTKAQFPEYYGAHPGDGDFDDIVVKEADGVETGFTQPSWTTTRGRRHPRSSPICGPLACH